MGQSQSQQIETFIRNYVNTSAISEVIQRYATRTNAVSTNTQDISIRINAEEIGGPINVSQEIESFIDVQQLVDRANTTSLTNDLQNVVEEQLRNAITSSTDFLANLFAIPANQEIRQDVLNNLSTYVRNVINEDTVDELLLSSANYQRGQLTIDTRYLRGPTVFTQRIQSNIMADNIVRQVINNALRNREVQELATRIETEEEREATAPLSDISRGIGAGVANFGATAGARIGAYALIIVGVIVLIIGILIGALVKTTPAVKGTIIAIAVVIALIMIGIGIYLVTRPITVV